MSTFVLVHGAWHGEWCWHKMIPLLQAAGHRVVSFDLPGHGMDATPTSNITSQDYADRLCSILDKESEPVILAGHSMGGMVITQAAEYRPDKIRLLVYVCAFLPVNGQTLLQLIENDRSTSLPVAISADKTYLTLIDDLVQDAFYNECKERDVIEAKQKLCLEPLKPFLAPVQLTEDCFGSVPRVYIETLKDHVLSPECQREMYARTPCAPIVTMNTDHSPFISQPEALTLILNNLA